MAPCSSGRKGEGRQGRREGPDFGYLGLIPPGIRRCGGRTGERPAVGLEGEAQGNQVSDKGFHVFVSRQSDPSLSSKVSGKIRLIERERKIQGKNEQSVVTKVGTI